MLSDDNRLTWKQRRVFLFLCADEEAYRKSHRPWLVRSLVSNQNDLILRSAEEDILLAWQNDMQDVELLWERARQETALALGEQLA